ncbi:hypothetical protein LCGC14_2289540, partial [marine sediment metagenome]
MPIIFPKGTIAVTSPSATPLLVQGTVGGQTVAISGSVGISSASINVGTIDIENIVGSVHIEGTVVTTISSGTLDHVSGIGTVSALLGGVLGTISSVSSGSVGILNASDIGRGTIATVQSGSVGIFEASQPLSVQGTLNHVSSAGTVSALLGGVLGTVSSVSSGSVGLLDQPIGVHGTIGNIQGGDIGTIQTVQSGSVGILDQPISVQGTLNHISSVGTVSALLGGDIGTIKSITSGTISALNPGTTGYDYIHKYVQAVQASTTIWDPAAGKKANITDLIVSAKGAGTVDIRCAGTLIVLDLAANGGMAMPFITPLQGTVDSNVIAHL